MNPTPMTKIEQLDNQMAMINSPDALRRLRGYQSMRGQLPMIAKEEGGILDSIRDRTVIEDYLPSILNLLSGDIEAREDRITERKRFKNVSMDYVIT